MINLEPKPDKPKFVPSNVSALPLVATLLPFKYRTPLAVPPERVTVLEADSVVNAPVFAVVAPTVPFSGPENPPAVSVVPSNVRLAESVCAPPVVL